MAIALWRNLQKVTQEPEPSRPYSVLVSYSYFEKDDTQEANFRYFQTVAMGIDSIYSVPEGIDFVVVQNGPNCGPCSALDRMLRYRQDITDALKPHLSAAFTGHHHFDLLHRAENEGMDIAAHNITLRYMKHLDKLQTYKFFMFLNSSVKGPFIPTWLPADWHWTRAFTDRLSPIVKAVSASLTCLPVMDLGGPGPRLESWAFAVDSLGLNLLIHGGVFDIRSCKLCPDGVVVQGEYGLTKVLFEQGYNVATLLSMYPRDIDWRDRQHWNCNDNVHPSRHGTYNHMTMHPLETVFVKSSWHVGEPFTSHYSTWFAQHAHGAANTEGSFDELMYTYAIGPEAIMPHRAALDYYRVVVHGSGLN